MQEKLRLRHAHLEKMRAHVESCAPNEACGLLAGRNGTVEQVLPIANQEQSPSRFRMNAREQLQGFRAIEDAGLELVGIFHSHPAGMGAHAESTLGPSATDIDEAAYPVVHVIWFRHRGLWNTRGFWIEDGRVATVALQIENRE